MCGQAKILDLQRRNAEPVEGADDIIFEIVDVITGFYVTYVTLDLNPHKSSHAVSNIIKSLSLLVNKCLI